MATGMTRVQKWELPSPAVCPIMDCVYNKQGGCDEPCINKGNGDAKCHKWSNRRLLIYITPSTDQDNPPI